MECNNAAAIELEGVSKHYRRKQVLHDVNLQIGAGENFALLGHNGAGKTTLMKLMLGLTRPSAGRITVQGADPSGSGASSLRRAIGYLPENVAFHDAMTGREVLSFYARLKGEPIAACDALFERVGLAAAAGDRLRTYSKGMRQRLGLAQALLGAPRLLFFDEPTTGLDPGLRLEFYGILSELRRQGTTVVISSHALTEVETRSDRLAILREGRLIACGSLDELRESARLPVRIRVSVDPGEAAAVAETIGGHFTLQKVNDRTVDVACPGIDKMKAVRHIAGLDGPVRDIEIMPPRLEEIYAYFSEQGGPR
jgi:Cu-processing system ATP-binding protein